jgi:hypothetical protein
VAIQIHPKVPQAARQKALHSLKHKRECRSQSSQWELVAQARALILKGAKESLLAIKRHPVVAIQKLKIQSRRPTEPVDKRVPAKTIQADRPHLEVTTPHPTRRKTKRGQVNSVRAVLRKAQNPQRVRARMKLLGLKKTLDWMAAILKLQTTVRELEINLTKERCSKGFLRS